MSTLFIRRLTWTVTNLELLNYFSKYGQVVKINQFYNVYNGLPLGKALIVFEKEESRNNAMNDKHNFYSKSMRLMFDNN